LVVGGGGVTIRAESINVSKSGMRVRTDWQLVLGQAVEVILLEGKPYPVPARVVWAGEPTGSNEYEFGLAYVTNPSQIV
jgi:hypothetical protein